MMDFSTIDLAALRALPAWPAPTGHQLSTQLGAGCYLDPPGYPSYFLQSVYTRHGDSPQHGATTVLRDVADPAQEFRVIETADAWDLDARAATLRRLWRPLPLEHARTQEWIAAVHRHMAHCYVDVEREEYGKPGTLIFPVPSYKLVDVDTVNEIARATAIATVDNHQAVRTIRRFYPAYTLTAEALATFEDAPPDRPHRGDWWTVEATRPTPDACRPRSLGPHPMNKTWCQFCGWYAPAGNEVHS